MHSDKKRENKQTILVKNHGAQVPKILENRVIDSISFTERRKKIGGCEVMLGQLVLVEAECLASRRMLLSEGSMPRRSVSSR